MEVDIQELKESLKQKNIQYVKVAITDIDGSNINNDTLVPSNENSD